MIVLYIKRYTFSKQKNTSYLSYHGCHLVEIKSFLIFQFLISKGLDLKAKVNFKIYGIIKWKANTDNTHIAQYL